MLLQSVNVSQQSAREYIYRVVNACQTISSMEIIGHQHLVCQRVLRANSNQWFPLAKSVEPKRQALRLPKSNLLLDLEEQGDYISKTVLYIDVSVCNGYEKDF